VRADESQEALAIADEAARVMPDRAAPLVLRGRALARLGRWGEAAAALDGARGRDSRALEEPAALLAWGRALARTGRVADADGAFRALLPRAASLPAAERASAGIEAGVLFSARGAAALDESTAVLRQARRDAQDAMQALAIVALALTLDRAGERDEARAVLATAPRFDARALFADSRVRDALADAGAAHEADALAAIALEGRDAVAAREAWTRYVAGPGGAGPWADHARAHLGGARGKGGTR
jgi:tetratricopeptide (TPR) repeat protein